MHPDIVELIHKNIDGLLTEEEKAAFEKLISEDSEAAALYQELSQMSDILAQAQPETPPAYLSKHIMNSLAPDRYQVKPKNTFVSSAKKYLAVINLRMLYAFSSGLAVAAVVFVLYLTSAGNRNVGDYNVLQGALVRNNTENQVSQMVEIPISFDGLEGIAKFRKMNMCIGVEIELNSSNRYQIEINFDLIDYNILSIVNHSGDIGIQTSDSRALILNGVGTNKWEIIFEPISEKRRISLNFSVTNDEHQLVKQIPFIIGQD